MNWKDRLVACLMIISLACISIPGICVVWALWKWNEYHWSIATAAIGVIAFAVGCIIDKFPCGKGGE